MRSLHLLVSADALSRYRERIFHVAFTATGPVEINWVLPSDPADAHALIDMAFISRDVTGNSTKTNILPDLANYYVALRRAMQLQWVHNHASGTDRPIFAELHERGVRITNSSGINANPVAHTAVGALIALGRKFPAVWQAQQDIRWAPMMSHLDLHDLAGQTALVIGMGPIGQKIARILSAMDMHVVGVTRDATKLRTTEGFNQVLDFESMQQAIPHTQYVVLACPLTTQTQGLIDAAFLSQLPQGSFLINVARGQVVIQKDLIEALHSHLGGAFLDVFATEPLETESTLWRMPNVMISPHTAGHFSGHAEKVAQLFMHNLNNYLTGQPLLNEWQPS